MELWTVTDVEMNATVLRKSYDEPTTLATLQSNLFIEHWIGEWIG